MADDPMQGRPSVTGVGTWYLGRLRGLDLYYADRQGFVAQGSDGMCWATPAEVRELLALIRRRPVAPLDSEDPLRCSPALVQEALETCHAVDDPIDPGQVFQRRRLEAPDEETDAEFAARIETAIRGAPR